MTSHDWRAMAAIVSKDLSAVRRAKGVVLPMLLVPFILLVILPFGIGVAARSVHHVDLSGVLRKLPGDLAAPIRKQPAKEQLVILVDGYLLAPLFLIVPLMVASVLAADAFAGEKERRTLEGLLHLPGRATGTCSRQGARRVPASGAGVVGRVRTVRRRGQHHRLEHGPPDLRAHQAVDGDDPVASAGGGRIRDWRSWCGCRRGPEPPRRPTNSGAR